MAVPVMRMGLVGFADEEYLTRILKVRSRVLQWEPWPFLEADALLVNGAAAEPVGSHLTRIPAPGLHARDTLLDLHDISRPTAFTLPLGNPAFRPPYVFDPRSAASIAQVLRLLEASVLPRAAQLTLGEALSERRASLNSPVYHLTKRGTMLGVVDLNNEVGLLPGVTPADIEAAEWHGRPLGANGVPPHFHRISVWRLMWRYAARRRVNVLPRQYLTATIHLHRPPAVDAGDLNDSHLQVLSELSRSPRTLAQLQQLTGLTEGSLTQAVGALYVVGSIGTDPGAAHIASWGGRKTQGPSGSSPAAEPLRAKGAAAAPLPATRRWSGDAGRDTVPTLLERSP